MKGFFIKDLHLMLNQKKMLVMFFVIGLLLTISNSDMSFAVSYTMFVMAIMASGTISYDTFENGMAYLMVLPAKRRDYVIEKYILVFATALITGVLISGVAFAVASGQGNSIDVKGLLLQCGGLFLTLMIMMSFMLPVNLKYGAEKGRLVLFAVFAIVFIAAYIIRNTNVFSQEQIENVMMKLMTLSKTGLITSLCVGSLLIMLISMFVSIKIMEKKEF